MPTRQRRRSVNRLVAITLSALLLAAACGGDDDDASDDAASDEGSGDATSAPTGPVEGCEGASTDPADLSAEREVARCEPEAPAAQPLAETESVTLAVADLGFSIYAPQFLADVFGEYEAENLDVEIIAMSSRDAIPQMITGEVDAFMGGPDAGFYNAVAQDISLKWVMGNFYPTDAGDVSVAQTGLWADREVFSDPENPDIAELEGSSIASITNGSVIYYPISEALGSGDLGMSDVEFTQLPSADMMQALQNDAVQAAWLLDPYWTQAVEDPDLVQLATQTPGEPIGGLFFGDDLTAQRPEVGQAMVRAMVRTINTYLTDEWYENDETVEALADFTGLTPESIRGSVTSTFDWEIREGSTDRLQDVFIETGAVESGEVIPEDELVDRSFYESAVGTG